MKTETDRRESDAGISIREYQESDREALVSFMEGLWDHSSSLDEYRRMIRKPEYGEIFTQEILEDVVKNEGIVYIATDGEKAIGFVACVFLRQSEKDKLRAVPLTDGRVSKLYVIPEYRDMKIGRDLMLKAEDFFRQAGCDLVRVEVFVPNAGAHRFYERLDYKDRVVDMVKKL